MQNKIDKYIRLVAQNRIVQHVLFWAFSYYFLLRFFAYSDELTKTDFIYTFLFHISLVLAVYVNILLFIPLLLSKKKYFLYGLSVIATLLFFTQINIWTFEYLTDFLFPGYYFISYYDFWSVIQFFIVYIGLTTLLKLSKGWFKLSEARKKVFRLEKEVSEAELQALRNQVNPHFLFNSLNSIYSLALENEKKAPPVILKLSEVMRYMLYDSNEKYVLLKEEISFLKNYVALQKTRSEEEVKISFSLKGEADKQKIAPLILIPFVENGFKHGIKGAIQNAFIDISVRINDKDIYFSVKNNKGTVDEIDNEKHKGIGLANVRRRLALIYKDRHDLKIEDKADYFFVKLKLKLE